MTPIATALPRRRSLLAAAGALAVGRPHAQTATLPELALTASDGTAVLARDAAANRWRAQWIDIWASWCGPCKQSFAWLNEMHARYAGAGLRVVAINVDTKAADAERFLKSHPAAFALAMDPAATAPKLLAAKAMPSAWLVRPDRSLILAHRGFRAEDGAELERAVRGALGV